MKRLVVFLVILSLATCLLGDVVEITFWHSMTNPVERESIAGAVAEFNKTHPNIKVNIVIVPGSETEITKLMTAVAGGTGPDIYYLDRFTVAQRAAYGVLEPLEDYLVQLGYDIGKLKEEFFNFAIEECQWNNKMWALPWDTDNRALYYNKKLFKEAGLDPNKPPVTLEELEIYAEKLTKKTAGRYTQVGFIPWAFQGWHYTWGWAFGGNFYDAQRQKLIFADDPRIVKAFEWLGDWAKKYNIKELEAFVSSFGMSFSGASIGGAEPINPFLAGKLAMVVDGNWLLAQILQLAPKDFEFGIAPIPAPAYGEKNSTWAGGWSLVIPKGAKHPKEAAEFIHYMATKGQIKFAIDTQHLPTLKEAVPGLLSASPAEQKIFADLLPTAHVRPVIPVGALLWDELTNAMQAVVYGEKSATEALRSAQEKVQKELDKWLAK
ncbi:MAG TPA: ABC transporter substrate-binding protein [Pseudothermotoga sp.]|nr:ABC transporter substrate-binding protein [Pseudothermotoga sp.]HOK84486.1 ABC transporter substrate-binding protein [Pseudothermotoga sp.]HPP70912.1 ABC transporter substrate-binding protein [Pseudothermotoga sp.]